MMLQPLEWFPHSWLETRRRWNGYGSRYLWEDLYLFRYRQLDWNIDDPQKVGGDMTFGAGYRNFLADSPTAVAQAVLTRLCLWMGEWYLNTGEGMAWIQRILGHAPGGNVPDSLIRERILRTPFVTRIEDYASTFEPTRRTFSVSCKIWTAFGPVTEAPAGALISPSGALVIPLTARMRRPEDRRLLLQQS